VIIRGLSFRAGGQHSKDEHDDKNVQLTGTDSQISNLIVPLEKMGYMVDVFSATQTARRHPTWTDELMAKFGTRLRSDRRIPGNPQNPEQVTDAKGPLGQGKSLRIATDAVSCYADEFSVSYELVVVFRHDMQFKHDRIADAIYSKKDKFTVPFRLIKNFRTDPTRTPDTMQTMPWRSFPYFSTWARNQSHRWSGEVIWRAMAAALPNNDADLDFLYPHEYADSDPEKVSNSFYKFSQRGEGVRCDQEAEDAAFTISTRGDEVCLTRAREVYCAEARNADSCHG
jgi:hypothetical protein